MCCLFVNCNLLPFVTSVIMSVNGCIMTLYPISHSKKIRIRRLQHQISTRNANLSVSINNNGTKKSDNGDNNDTQASRMSIFDGISSRSHTEEPSTSGQTSTESQATEVRHAGSRINSIRSLRHSNASEATGDVRLSDVDMNQANAQKAVLDAQIDASNPTQFKTWYSYISYIPQNDYGNKNKATDHFHLFASHLVRFVATLISIDRLYTYIYICMRYLDQNTIATQENSVTIPHPFPAGSRPAIPSRPVSLAGRDGF